MTLNEIGGVVGFVGGTLSIIKWVQEYRERRQKQRDDEDYKAFIVNVIEVLNQESLGTIRKIAPEHNAWAGRAVSERRLVWGPDGKSVMLPSWRGDE